MAGLHRHTCRSSSQVGHSTYPQPRPVKWQITCLLLVIPDSNAEYELNKPKLECEFYTMMSQPPTPIPFNV